jgi:glycosyltransferase involved in cell wall biosynthesis
MRKRQTPHPLAIVRAPTVAVLIPCLNEAVAIDNVVKDFRRALLDATIFVYDNGLVDQAASIARASGAVARQEPLRGHGNVMRRMFADVEADVWSRWMATILTTHRARRSSWRC